MTPPDLTQHETTIFAEIVDAPTRDVGSIIERARYLRDEGADVIDLGCLPETDFPHLEESIAELHRQDFKVSVDSLDRTELERGARGGADYLFSLSTETLEIAQEFPVTPVIIGSPPNDLEDLCGTVECALKLGIPFYADPILDPIHFGFVESIVRYRELRQRYDEIKILMGIGNLSELTHVDTIGVNAMLFGIISELGIDAVLTTEVSPHCRRVVRECDWARRVFLAAKRDQQAPQHIDPGLLALHDLRPFPHSTNEIAEIASKLRIRTTGFMSANAVCIYSIARIIRSHRTLTRFIRSLTSTMILVTRFTWVWNWPEPKSLGNWVNDTTRMKN